MKHLILAGAGHAHLQILQNLIYQSLPNTIITLISPFAIQQNECFEPQRINLATLTRRAKVRWLEDSIVKIDARQKMIFTKKGAQLPYDFLSLNIGSGVASCEIHGVKQHASIFKANSLQAHQLKPFLKAYSCALIGSSPTALHLTLTIIEKRRQAGISGPFYWITNEALLPSILEQRQQQKLQEWLAKQGVTLITNKPVERVAEYVDECKSIYFTDGTSIDAKQIVRVVNPSAHPLFKESGLAVNEHGFALTSPTLQSLLDEHIFIVGSSKTHVAAPEIDRYGLHENLEASILWENLRKLVGGREKKTKLRMYLPQLKWWTILQAGENQALLIIHGFIFMGAWCQWLLQQKRRARTPVYR